MISASIPTSSMSSLASAAASVSPDFDPAAWQTEMAQQRRPCAADDERPPVSKHRRRDREDWARGKQPIIHGLCSSRMVESLSSGRGSSIGSAVKRPPGQSRSPYKCRRSLRLAFPPSRWAHHNAIHVLSALDRRRKGFSRGKSLPDKYLQFGAATLDSSLKRQAVDGRVKPGQDENARERGLSAGSEKLTSITFPLRNAEAGAMILPVATKSPRLASRGEDGRARGHLWRLRHGAAEERIFLVESVVTH